MKKEERKEITKYLRWGDKTKIAELACVSRQTVERWIKGESISSTVEPYILEFVKQRKAEVKKRFNENVKI